jgi:hypothetical protein
MFIIKNLIISTPSIDSNLFEVVGAKTSAVI